MRLFLTAQSERGKPVTKSGNEVLLISTQDEKRNAIITIALDIDGLGQWHVKKAFGAYRAMYELREQLNQEIDNWIRTQEELAKPKTAREKICSVIGCENKSKYHYQFEDLCEQHNKQ